MEKQSIRQNIEYGRPYTSLSCKIPTHQLDTFVRDAKEASLNVRAALYRDFVADDRRVVTFSDDDVQNKYISWRDNNGAPLFGPWDPKQPATDVGVRGVNPSYNGVVNPTTVIHADSLAIQDFQERGAPSNVIEAIDAIARLNTFVEDKIAKP